MHPKASGNKHNILFCVSFIFPYSSGVWLGCFHLQICSGFAKYLLQVRFPLKYDSLTLSWYTKVDIHCVNVDVDGKRWIVWVNRKQVRDRCHLPCKPTPNYWIQALHVNWEKRKSVGPESFDFRFPDGLLCWYGNGVGFESTSLMLGIIVTGVPLLWN